MTTTYDEVAYPSKAFRQTHPDRLAAHAHLFGLPFAPVETCRVLDIGAGDGANIIPMALVYPKARFVGFDLSAAAVARGRADIEALGLRNVELFEADILDVDLGAEPFDYTIAHGVYSWVPETVRNATLDLNRRCLAQNGVAFISYNALPGCRVRQALRDMLLYAARDVHGVEARAAAAAVRLREIVDTFPKTEAFNALIVNEAEHLLERGPSVLSHDELGEVYHPVHLHQFRRHIAGYGLQFLTEAEPSRCGEGFAPPYAVDNPDFDVLAHAQDMDFTSVRFFRQSLVVRDHVTINRLPCPERLLDLHISSTARREESGAFISGTIQFEVTDDILARAIETIGGAWPATVPVASMIDDVERAGALLRMYWLGVVELHTAPMTYVGANGARPRASPVARLQAGRGQNLLTTLSHGMVEVDDAFSLQFIAGLDGSRTRAEIARDIAPALGGAIEVVTAQMDVHLDTLAQMPLLLG